MLPVHVVPGTLIEKRRVMFLASLSYMPFRTFQPLHCLQQLSRNDNVIHEIVGSDKLESASLRPAVDTTGISVMTIQEQPGR